MSDLERIKRAVEAVRQRCREANPDHLKIPPSGADVMEWFAEALEEPRQS